MNIPLTDEIVVVAHNDPAWPGSYRVCLDACGRPIAYGRDPHKAAALRLIEEGCSPEHTLVLRYADNTKPKVHASIGDVLNPTRKVK
jgi:hypothetical protein